MKTYSIKTGHDIYIDSYNEGEGKHVNYYDIKAEVKAENPTQAIEKYFEDTLYYNFNMNLAYIAHEEDEDQPVNVLHYSVLVDEENAEASVEEVELWKEGKKVLYSNNIYLSIYELVEVKIGG